MESDPPSEGNASFHKYETNLANKHLGIFRKQIWTAGVMNLAHEQVRRFQGFGQRISQR